MRILGVDPGLASTGVGVIEEVDSQHWRCVTYNFTITKADEPLPVRLERIHALVLKTVTEFRPDVMAVESVFFARNVRSAVMMAHGRGAAILAAVTQGIPVAEYSPLEIKQSVVGKGRAGKPQVQQMVRVLLALGDEVISEHASDALACALCHSFRRVAQERTAAAAKRVEGGAADEAYEQRKALLGMMKKRRR